METLTFYQAGILVDALHDLLGFRMPTEPRNRQALITRLVGINAKGADATYVHLTRNTLARPPKTLKEALDTFFEIYSSTYKPTPPKSLVLPPKIETSLKYALFLKKFVESGDVAYLTLFTLSEYNFNSCQNSSYYRVKDIKKLREENASEIVKFLVQKNGSVSMEEMSNFLKGLEEKRIDLHMVKDV